MKFTPIPTPSTPLRTGFSQIESVSQYGDASDVMPSTAKHLASSSCYEDEILRLRLRMTLRHSLSEQKRAGSERYPPGEIK